MRPPREGGGNAYENAEEWEDMFRFNEAPARRRGK